MGLGPSHDRNRADGEIDPIEKSSWDTPSFEKAGPEPMQSLELLRQSATDGVADWLSQLVEIMPDLAPQRADPTAEDPAAAGWLHRFVREVVTVDSVTRGPLTNIQIFVIEFALDCVD